MRTKILCLILKLAVLANFTFADERPNVLFIAIDDINDWIGVFDGHPQAKTPNLDRLNEMGAMVMYDAHAPSPVCGPSRSAILTGKFPHSTGVYGNNTNLRNAPKAKDLLTLPQYFSKHGYHSLSRGKIFHVHEWEGEPRADHGQWAYDEWVQARGWAPPISDERPVNQLPPDPDTGPHGYIYRAFDWGPTEGNDETRMRDYRTATWAAEQLTERDFGKPFFMAVGISLPHLPWYLPQKYFDMFPPDEVIMPEVYENELDDILDRNGNVAVQPHSAWIRAEAAGRHEEAVAAYLAAIAFVDDCIGVLLDGLENSPHADNTIIMLWGDHGWHLTQKKRYGKATLWQESCRVPFMVKVPGVTKPNQRSYGVVNLIDMYPTLLELCGLPPNPENEGRSFVELLHNPDMEWNEPTLTDWGYGGHRVYDGRYSYSIYIRNGQEELYDHKTDPNQWHNLVRDPEYADIVERLSGYIPTEREPRSPTTAAQ